jgi:hypothetical protein
MCNDKELFFVPRACFTQGEAALSNNNGGHLLPPASTYRYEHGVEGFSSLSLVLSMLADVTIANGRNPDAEVPQREEVLDVDEAYILQIDDDTVMDEQPSVPTCQAVAVQVFPTSMIPKANKMSGTTTTNGMLMLGYNPDSPCAQMEAHGMILSGLCSPYGEESTMDEALAVPWAYAVLLGPQDDTCGATSTRRTSWSLGGQTTNQR